MQVSVERTSELERKMTVELSGDVIKDKVDTRIKDLAREATVDGFRPGKVPQRVIRHRFGKRVREEVLGDLIQSSFQDAITEQQLSIAGRPSIAPEDLEDGGFKYIASFEILPEFKLADLSTLKITRPVVEVTEDDINDTIERLRRQRATWNKVDREVKNDDRVSVDFNGFIGDQNITDDGVKGEQFVIGSNNMLPEFDANLLGRQAGDEVEFDVVFPEDSGKDEYRGKTGHFKAQLNNVEEIELPAIDETFVKGFGTISGQPDDFRADIKMHLQRELDDAVKSKLKTSTLDALLEAHEMQLPRALVEQEIELILDQLNGANAKSGGNDVSDTIKAAVEEQANRRVKLGLLLGEIIKTNGMKADKDRLRSTVMSLAQSYEDPESVIEWYYSQPDQLARVEQSVLEGQVVDWVVEQAQVTDESAKFSEFMDERLRGSV